MMTVAVMATAKDASATTRMLNQGVFCSGWVGTGVGVVAAGVVSFVVSGIVSGVVSGMVSVGVVTGVVSPEPAT